METVIRDDITYIRVPDETGAVWTYAAVRSAEAAGDNMPPGAQAVRLKLPDAEAAVLRGQLDAMRRKQVVIIGTTVGDTWATGPFAGQPAPQINET